MTVILITTVLGPMLVAGTPRGVCHVSFGDDETLLEQEFARRSETTSPLRDEDGVALWAHELAEYLAGKSRTISLPLDVEGTPFQKIVWAELCRIPFGARCSYREVAIAIGRPKAARAVARACASNRVAVLIPCHRVVRETGALGGYRWGIERKQQLLEAEHTRA